MKDLSSKNRYAFSLQELIPQFSVPPDNEDVEPIIDLKELLNRICEDSGIDESIDYSVQPQPELSEKDFLWARSLEQYRQCDRQYREYGCRE